MDPFAVAEIEGGSDALRENVCRGRVVRRAGSGGGGDVERLIRPDWPRAREACSLLLKFLRYYSISRFYRNQMPCMISARDRGTTDLGNRIGVHLAAGKKPGKLRRNAVRSLASLPFPSSTFSGKPVRVKATGQGDVYREVGHLLTPAFPPRWI